MVDTPTTFVSLNKNIILVLKFLLLSNLFVIKNDKSLPLDHFFDVYAKHILNFRMS